MKKFFKKNLYLFLILLMFSSMTFFGVEKLNEKQNNENITYAQTGNYLQNLLENGSQVETSYSLANYYPLVPENQTDSNFCWIYSTLKSLETSLMIQQSEYCNFSEVGMAYLFYLQQKSLYPLTAEFNSAGNFSDFSTVFNQYGLVYESDVSNDIFMNIDETNYQNYSYIKDYAVKNLNNSISPYDIGSNSYFRSLMNYADKRMILKKFVKTYGGLFVGIEGGTIYLSSDKVNYLYRPNESLSGDKTVSFTGDHAVCLIGWDDNIEINNESGAFLVMNSWGIDNDSFSFFYVPYSYTFVYSTASGFICENAEEVVEIISTPAAKFMSTYFPGSNNLKNMFCYNDNVIGIQYKFNVSSLDQASVKIYNGNEDLTNRFTITYTNSEKSVMIRLSDKSAFYGGYYSIRFYSSGSLKGIKSLYIFSGTETSYFKYSKFKYFNQEYDLILDMYALNNAFLSESSVTTLCFSKNYDNEIEFNLTPLNVPSIIKRGENKVTWKDLNFTISNYSILKSNGTSISPSNVISIGNGQSFKNSNEYYINFKNLYDYGNCLLRFTLNIDSVVAEYNCTRQINFQIFISAVNSYNFVSREYINTEDLFVVNYELNGGKNSKDNLNRYPNYSVDSTMVDDIALFAPIKTGYTFLGWYLSPDFSGDAVTQINDNLSGDITLYAKWEEVDIDYFDIALALNEVKDYNSNNKSLTDDLIYGDSIKYKFDFFELPALAQNNYSIQYYFYSNDSILDSGYIQSGSSSNYFCLNFPDLEVGSYTFKVVVTVVVNNSYICSKTVEQSCLVSKRKVSFVFSNLNHTYDGESYYPTIEVGSNSIYSEDLAMVTLADLYIISDRNSHYAAGEYVYKITDIANSNYCLDTSISSECTMIIEKRKVDVTWNQFSAVYDGRSHLPTYNVSNVLDGDIVKFSFDTPVCINAGTYTINVVANSITNENYVLNSSNSFTFTISKSNIKIIIGTIEERKQTSPYNRKQVTASNYTIEGNVCDNDDLKLTFESLGLSSEESGEYDIHCRSTNSNYNLTYEKGLYILTGYYYVYYQLPNGKTYIERVEENNSPLGVTKEQLELSAFDEMSYSEEYILNGKDIYVAVFVKSYKWEIFVGAGVAVIAIAYLVYYIKKKKNFAR